MTVTYCTTANDFISAANCEIRIEPKSKTPLALNVKCPTCSRVFKSLPRRKDGMVWVAIHALPKPKTAAPTTQEINEALKNIAAKTEQPAAAEVKPTARRTRARATN